MAALPEAERWDPDYHVQYLAMPADACYEDFLKLIASLHEPTLDRAGPCSAPGSSTACRTTGSPSIRR